MFGDEPNDRNFCCDGLVWPDRTPKPAMLEHKQLAAPVRVTRTTNGAAEIHNRGWFRDLSWLSASYEIADVGEVVASGTLVLPDVDPRSFARLEMPDVAAPATGER
jgi:beta-galactosidase